MTPPKITVQKNPVEPAYFPVVRGRQIRTDSNDRACLNDIWEAAGSDLSRRPAKWRQNPSTRRLIAAVQERIVRGSYNSTEPIAATRGRFGTTFAHPILALAFAEFVDASLALEVREVFLHHKLADPSLADEILERASPEANLWAGQRALARAGRRNFTDVLKNHGVQGRDYGFCTDTLYLSIFDKGAQKLKAERKVARRASLRDAMTTLELACVATGEALATERIIEERCHGGEQCRIATARSAGFVRRAIEADRCDRRASIPVVANDTSKPDIVA